MKDIKTRVAKVMAGLIHDWHNGASRLKTIEGLLPALESEGLVISEGTSESIHLLAGHTLTYRDGIGVTNSTGETIYVRQNTITHYVDSDRKDRKIAKKSRKIAKLKAKVKRLEADVGRCICG